MLLTVVETLILLDSYLRKWRAVISTRTETAQRVKKWNTWLYKMFLVRLLWKSILWDLCCCSLRHCCFYTAEYRCNIYKTPCVLGMLWSMGRKHQNRGTVIHRQSTLTQLYVYNVNVNKIAIAHPGFGSHPTGPTRFLAMNWGEDADQSSEHPQWSTTLFCFTTWNKYRSDGVGQDGSYIKDRSGAAE